MFTQRTSISSLAAFLLLFGLQTLAFGQDGEEMNPADSAAQPSETPTEEVPADEPAEKPQPLTTADPAIKVAQLKLLLKPLTRAELEVEAQAWRDLVKAKAQEIADLQVGVKIESAEATSDSAEDTDSPDSDSPKTDEESAPQDAASLSKLQEQRTALIDRLNAVLDAWELKGGDVEEYRQYAAAVGGLDIDVTDAASTWAAITGWLASPEGGYRWLWNIVKFLAVAVVFYILALIAGSITRHFAERIKGASKLLKDFLANFVKQVVLVVGLIVAASALEVNISPLLAMIGGAAFVIGLALQGTLSNFASGLIILGYRPFDVGDVIDAGGVSGIVDSMNLITTKIRTFDNKVMIVPNNKIATDTITNASASATRRVDMVFGIGYDDDIEKATEILSGIVASHELVLPDPAPVIQLNELADSSVNFIVRPWVKASDYWAVYWDITKTAKRQFDAAGISIPYPQRDVHIYQASAASDGTADSAAKD